MMMKEMRTCSCVISCSFSLFGNVTGSRNIDIIPADTVETRPASLLEHFPSLTALAYQHGYAVLRDACQMLHDCGRPAALL